MISAGYKHKRKQRQTKPGELGMMDQSSEPNGKYVFPFMLEGLLQSVPHTFVFGHFTFFNSTVKGKDDGHKVQSLSQVLISVL